MSAFTSFQIRGQILLQEASWSWKCTVAGYECKVVKRAGDSKVYPAVWYEWWLTPAFPTVAPAAPPSLVVLYHGNRLTLTGAVGALTDAISSDEVRAAQDRTVLAAGGV